ncbi:hypothetical protein LCGC14_2132300 [marine sediment metagenome]|uniref:Uncharacterized protein n=1 Tax=marine sediment metagenome TaxID=412755 RepID=A0A0F9EN59_9ZZZZ
MTQMALVNSKVYAERLAEGHKGWTVRPFTADNGRELWEVVAEMGQEPPRKRLNDYDRMRAFKAVSEQSW